MSTLERQTFSPPSIATAAAPPLPRDWRAYAPWLLPLVGLVVALALPLHWCLSRWGLDSPQSYQPLVPLGAAWLAWQRRAEVAQAWRLTAENKAGVGNIGLLLAGGLALMAGHVMQVGLIGIVGAVGVLAGGVLCVGGRAVLRALAAPLLFLLLTAPLPSTLLGQATARLQMFCTVHAGHMLANLDVPNRVEGNLIFLRNFQLEVIAPCSGVSIVLPVLVMTLGTMLARRRPWWQALGALVPAGLIALLMNVLRITAVGLVGSANPSLARTLHDPLSWLFTALAFGGTLWVISYQPRPPRAAVRP